MVVSSKQLWAVLCYNGFMVCEEVVKVDGKGLVIKPVSIFNGLFTASKGHSNRKGLISS
jgi:hypothetical protein